MKNFLFIIIIVLGGFTFFTTRSCINNYTINKELQKDTALLNLKVNWQQNHINNLQTAYTEIETFYQDKIGFISKEYKIDLMKFKLMLIKLQNKALDTVFIIKEGDLLETTIDSLKTNDLALYYQIEVLGMLKSASFDYRVTSEKVIEKKIIYQDRFIDKPVEVWTPKRQLYLYTMYGFKNHSIEGGLIYLTKKRIGLIGGYEILYINYINYSNFKAGILYRPF